MTTDEEYLTGLDDDAVAELRSTLHSPPVPGGGSKLSAREQGEKLRGMAEAMRDGR